MPDLFPVELNEEERKYIASHLRLPTYDKKEEAELAASILNRMEQPTEVVEVGSVEEGVTIGDYSEGGCGYILREKE